MKVNYDEGWGALTNAGVVNELVKDAKIGGTIDPTVGQSTLDYISKKYGLDSQGNFHFRTNLKTYDEKGELVKVYGVTTPIGFVRISSTAFKNGRFLRAVMCHEYGHLLFDRVPTNGPGGFGDSGWKWKTSGEGNSGNLSELMVFLRWIGNK